MFVFKKQKAQAPKPTENRTDAIQPPTLNLTFQATGWPHKGMHGLV